MNPVEQLLNSLFIMASLVEARDPYTGGHLWRVSQYCRILAEQGGLPLNQVARISFGGFLHDLGKIAVPDAILNKPGRLTEEEYEIIKTHPEVGRRLLSDHPLAGLAEVAIFSHHERPDGTGYPQRLPLERIAVDARIVGICDAFDAMTSTRPYRKGMPVEQAIHIIRDNLGTQFDPQWGELFLALGEAGTLDHIANHSEPGIPLHDCPMCGASIVVRRHQHEGDPAYCRACGAETRIREVNGQTTLEATGKRGTPAQLEPDVDTDLIRELVSESASLLAQISDQPTHQVI
ncbi:MAG: HD-GYP domain-containing protein [Betaproteobacteria bacterium]|nr:HD-GYP domain-containing protein [Betaproteobacteria bacterium]